MTTPEPPASVELPRVTVLMATWNGLAWLPEQVDSILSQHGVDVRLVALDDESTDGTREWLVGRAALDPRVKVLPSMGKSGGSAPNFYRLIQLAVPTLDGYLAFSDQDDVWHPGKLKKHVGILEDTGV